VVSGPSVLIVHGCCVGRNTVVIGSTGGGQEALYMGALMSERWANLAK
jgi:hypothetical protein